MLLCVFVQMSTMQWFSFCSISIAMAVIIFSLEIVTIEMKVCVSGFYIAFAKFTRIEIRFAWMILTNDVVINFLNHLDDNRCEGGYVQNFITLE